MIEIYTDGACKGNPGPGGWAAVVIENGRTAEYTGYAPRTTNQRMEVTAAIEGLRRTPAGAQVTLHSDSEYLVHTMTRSWKRRANLDLWAALDQQVSARSVTFRWVRGHNGDPLQERADRLASRTAMGESRASPGAFEDSRGGSSARTPSGRGGADFPPVAGGADEPSRRETPFESPKPPHPGDLAEAIAPVPLSHLDERGQARMVDVGAKADTAREAVAKGRITMRPSTLEMVRTGQAAKGDVLAVARVAGIMGAKKTPDLVPLAHPLMITGVTVDFDLDANASAIEITAAARTTGKTGVEMEALTAVACAALAIYDMLKAADRGMRIEAVRLVSKRGGKSGEYTAE